MAGSITFNITPVGSVFNFCIKKIDVPRNLPSDKYAKFSPHLEFAGFSKRHKALSLRPQSNNKAEPKVTAHISGYPICTQQPGEDWVDIQRYFSGVLLKTDKPQIVLTLNEDFAEVMVWIEAKQLIDQYELWADRYVKESEIGNTVSVQIAPGLSICQKYPQVRMLQEQQYLKLAIPKNVLLQADQWHTLGRYVFSGNNIASFAETTAISSNVNDNSLLTFRGSTSDEVEKAFGIQGTPVIYSAGHLYYRIINITDPEKFGSAYPHIKGLGKMKVSIVNWFQKTWRPPYVTVLLEDLLKNTEYLQGCAGVVLASDHSEAEICISSIDKIKYPLRQPREENAVCPNDLIPQFFIPAKDACRKYKLDGITRYRIFNPNLIDGNWVFIPDLENLSCRDLRLEHQNRQQRKQELEQRHGVLPEGWQKLTDAQISEYFNIQTLIKEGKLVLFQRGHNFMPSNWLHYNKFRNWLKEQGHIYICPITETDYVTRFESMNEVACVSGFWKLLEEILDEDNWLKALIASPTVQALAVAELI